MRQHNYTSFLPKIALLLIAAFGFAVQGANAQCGVQTPPYSQTFDQFSTPTCWTVTTPSGDGWDYGQMGDAGYGASGISEHTGNGGYYAFIDFSGTEDTTYLESPEVDVSGMTQPPRVQFYFFSNNTNTPGDNNTLELQAFDGTAWQTVNSWKQDDPNWVKVEEDLSAYIYGTGVVRVRFLGMEDASITGFYNDILLDDVTIEETPTCPAPSGLTSTVISTDSVELSWTSNASGTSWEILFGPQGFTPGSGAGDTVVTTNNPDTLVVDSTVINYDFYVREVCAVADTSAWTGPHTVNKPCPAAFSAPYSEDFFTNSTPTCWSITTPYGSGWEFGQLGDPGYGADNVSEHTGNGGYFAFVDFSSPEDSTYLVSPPVDVNSLTYAPQVVFWYFSNNTDNPGENNTLAVQAYDGSNWQTIHTIKQDNPDWTRVVLDLDNYIYGSGLVRVRLAGWEDQNITAFYNDLLVDDFLIREKPANEFASIDIQNPASSSCDYDSTAIMAEFMNMGAVDEDSIEVGYTINGGAPVLDTIFTLVQEDSSEVHTFPVTTAFSADGTYELKVFSNLPGDANGNNDTTTMTVINGSGSLNPNSTDTMGITDGDFTFETSEFICGTKYEDYNCSRILGLEIDSIWHEDALDELDIQLISPSGTTLDLWLQLGSFSDQSMYNLVFTDTASQNITSATAPFTGTYRPQEAAGFAKFKGEPINGQWTLRIYNDDCCDTAAIYGWSMRVLDPTKPQPDLGADTTICKDGAVLLDPGNNPDWSYVWQNNSTDSSFSVVGDFLDTASTHTYYVTVTDESEFNGCSNTDTVNINVEYCTSIDENGYRIGFSIYPNPATEQVSIDRSGEVKNKTIRYEVVDLNGRVIDSKTTNEGRVSFNVSEYSKGIYFLKGTNADNEKDLFQEKIVVQ